MWFKQIQLFQLKKSISYSPETLAAQLEPLGFTSCLPSLPASSGWTSPLDEAGASLVHAMNGYIMICMQMEEKILPATVIRQELMDKIKQLEETGNRKIRQKEKLSLKDEIIVTLLPRAFSKLSRVYAYIDTKNNILILDTTNAKKTEQFMMLFKRSVTEDISPFELKKLSPVMTHWLKAKDHLTAFSIEKICLLQDPDQEKRTVRCQHQDLFANSIQSLLKEGCVVKQLALCWEDRIQFVLTDDFMFRSIQYLDIVLSQSKEIDTENKQQEFDADFFIMTETLSALLKDLLKLFPQTSKVKDAEKVLTV